MTFVPIGNGTRAVFHAKQNGQDRVNVFHYRWAVVPSSSDLAALAAVLAGNTAGDLLYALRQVAHSSVQWDSLTLTNTDIAGGNQYTLPLAAAGVRTGTAAPGNVTIAIAKRTGIAARWARGRAYVVGLTTTDFVNDILATGTQTLATQLASAIATSRVASGQTYQAAVGSRRTQIAIPILTCTLDTVADSMRRRLLNRGR